MAGASLPKVVRPSVLQSPESGKKRWTDDEVLIAVYLYRFGWEDLGVDYATIGKAMGRRPGTIIFRMANFLSYDGVAGGLGHGGGHAEEVYKKYRDVPREALRALAIQGLMRLSTANATLTEI